MPNKTSELRSCLACIEIVLKGIVQCHWIITAIRELVKGESEGLLQLPIDKVMLEYPAFHPYIEPYAKDEETFHDYYISHKKLSELVLTPILAQCVFGVAFAAAFVILSNIYEVRKRNNYRDRTE